MNQYDPNQARLSSYEIHRRAQYERAIVLGEFIADCCIWVAKKIRKIFTRT